MRAALRYHIRYLFAFYGRDSRATFWYAFGAVVAINLAASAAFAVPMTLDAVVDGIGAAQSGDDAAVQAAVLTEMGAVGRRLAALTIGLGLLNTVLLAAPLVRRLHDSGNSGLWAIFAAVANLVVLSLAWREANDVVLLMRQMAATGNADPMTRVRGHLDWQSLVAYVPLVMVVVIGLLRSTPGPNRYGTEPTRF